jgi:hypothetical protein
VDIAAVVVVAVEAVVVVAHDAVVINVVVTVAVVVVVTMVNGLSLQLAADGSVVSAGSVGLVQFGHR